MAAPSQAEVAGPLVTPPFSALSCTFTSLSIPPVARKPGGAVAVARGKLAGVAIPARQHAWRSEPCVIMEQACVSGRLDASPSSGILAVLPQRQRREFHT